MIKEFIFKKKDGSIRILRGTTDMNYAKKNFPEFEIKGNGRKTPDHLQLVWDIEDKCFKSFIKENLLFEKRISKKDIELNVKNSWFSSKAKNKTIKRNATPYFILMILSKGKNLTKNDIEFQINFYHKTKMKNNVSRILDAFYKSRLVAKVDYHSPAQYIITDRGKEFFESI